MPDHLPEQAKPMDVDALRHRAELRRSHPDWLTDRVIRLERQVSEYREAVQKLASHACDNPFNDCREVKKFRKLVSSLTSSSTPEQGT